MPEDQPWDVAVVGAGAAGLVAALRAAERGRRTLLLEKNRRPGVKILISGGTRCNLTHDTDNRGIVEAYGNSGRFLHSALAALGVRESIALFEAEGVETKVEPGTGKVFPASDRAVDVLAALRARFDRSGATLALEEPLVDLRRSDSPADSPANAPFELLTARRALTAQSVILTTGGQSYPGCGTTGDGYALAAKFGHTIVPPRPALVPITTTAAWVLDLRGITLPDVTVTIVEGGKTGQGGKKLASRRSSLLFAHFGLTGPAALDVSRAVSGHPSPGTLVAEIDLLPDENEEQLVERLRQEITTSGKKSIANVLGRWVVQRLSEDVLREAGVSGERKMAELSKADRQRIARTMKHLPIPVSGTLGFKKAEVTAGGVSLQEVDSRTMQSKLAPGLFFAGELLDLDGPIGGYNFQAAWSTGWLAGSCC